MLDFDIKSKTSLEEEIISLLQVLQSDPTAVDRFAKLIRLANQYVQSDPTTSDIQASKFKSHQLCGKCQINRTHYDGDAQRERRLRYTLQVCMLRALSFKLNRSISTWLQGLYSTMTSCIDCYKGFLEATELNCKEFLYTFEEDNIERFLTFSEDWEEKMALNMAAQHDFKNETIKSRLSPSELYAMLALSGTLAARDKKEGIYNLLKSSRERLRVESLPEAPSGLLAMAIDDDETTVSWLDSKKCIPPMSNAISSTKAVKSLLNQGIERDRWEGIAIILRLAPSILKGTALLNMLLQHLGEGNSKAASSFRFFNRILEERGATLWEVEDAEYPLVVLTTILDNAAFRLHLSKAEVELDYLNWMKGYLASLVTFSSQVIPSTSELNINGEEASKTRIFEDAMKRVIYFLVETMQQGNVCLESRDRCLSLAVHILQSFLVLEGDKYDVEDAIRCARSSASSVNLHSSVFVSYALQGQLPNTREILKTNMKSRVTAFDMIKEIFEMDCNTLSDSFLILSNTTTELHAIYKKLRKQNSKKMDRKEISLSIERFYIDAVQDLNMSPLISSELWKEAYNKFRLDVDDVSLFLQPLARLSTFTVPQISSYVISVKDEQASLPSYIAYVDRLKSCLANFKGRLRSVRYNLPRLLLDLCDERGISSSASQSLSVICYKMADSIIQSNLCPEQEVHKAAQSLIRNTFEEAETREDCFRALLQCNPVLSLKGIRDYLEAFLVAASNLVEANEAAKWMVRSFSDVLNILCSQTDGLLRKGTLYSLVDKKDVRSQVRQLFPSIWQLMCRSIAIIFKRTPNWSYILPHSELTAWFRDVLLFASDLVEEVEVVQAAVDEEGSRDSPGIVENILIDLAIPLEEAVSWFRMNDMGIVQETRDYFIKGLRLFKGTAQLPNLVRERMLTFIDAQSKIEDSKSRMTLLTLKDLSELRHLLDANEVIEVPDSEEETGIELVEVITTPKEDPKRDLEQAIPPSKIQARRVIDPPRASVQVQSSSRIEEEQNKLKQQKLAFEKLDSSTSRPFLSKPKPAPLPPKPQFASTSQSINRYQSAGTRSSKPSSAAFAEAKRSYHASSTWKAIPRGFSHTGRLRDLADPQAPLAKRTFTGTAMNRTANTSHESNNQVASADSESGDESEKEEEVLGLADLIGKNKSPIKMRPKSKVPPRPPLRRTVMVEDAETRKRQLEMEEAERKRKLKERANLNPLHRMILSWDFYAECNYPPLNQMEGAAPPKYDKLRSIYRNPQEYIDVFNPMITLEAWAEFVNARVMLGRGAKEHLPSPITINGRSVTDSFVVITVTLHVQPSKQMAFYNEADIVYVRESSDAAPGRRVKSILAKVDAYKGDSMRRMDQLTLRCCLQSDLQGMTSLLVAGTRMEMGKLFTLTTINREYEALQVVPYFDLIPSILQAKSTIKEMLSDVEIKQVESDYGVNRPQAEAILGSLKAEQGFSLIQGPPGTGKTKTICSLVAHFIQKRQVAAVPIKAGQSKITAAVIVNTIKKKILLCAPSNAAVDEVAKRVHEGVKLKNGKMIKPLVVRIGRESAINTSVKMISLEALVERKMTTSCNSSSQVGDIEDDASKIQAELRKLKDERDAKRAELENARLTNVNEKIMAQLDVEIRHIGVKRMDLMSKLDEAKDQRQTAHRQQNADRKRIEQEILAGADVICATLGGAGHNTLYDLPFDFETVIIDEAAQAVELDTLIPLRYGCQRCILVGDPNQLPPTVISQEAEKLDFSKSLFVRLFHNPKNFTNLLSIQYRMNPSISKFPSVEFYDGKLIDGEGMASLTTKVWHKDSLLAPFRFFDCKGSKEISGRGTSLINREEATMAAALYERLRKEAIRLGGESVEGKVGVISMYKEQIFELQGAFEVLYGKGIENVVDFNTVDGFQGQEKDIIILSCVRSEGIGFLNDFRRVNVAITRAKSNLFIIGHATNLERTGRGSIWPRLIEMARKENCLMTVASEVFRRPAFPNNSIRPLPIGSGPTGNTNRNGSNNQDVPSEIGKKKRKRKKDGHLDESASLASSSPPPVNPVRGPVTSPIKRKADAVSNSYSSPNVKRINTVSYSDGAATTAARANSQSATRPAPRPSLSTQPINSASLPRGVPLGPPPPGPPPLRPRPRPQIHSAGNEIPAARPNKASGEGGVGVPILPPAPVANAPRPAPRPAQLYKAPVFSSQEGPSDKAKSSLFIQKSSRLARPKRN